MKTFAGICGALLCTLVVAGPAAAASPKPLPALTPVGPDALTRALARGRLTEAEYALERARSLFALGRVRRRFGDVAKPGPRDATPILRDLAARVPFLPETDRAAARGVLSRPTDSTFGDEHHYKRGTTVLSACDATRPLCIHWVETTADAPPATDLDPANGIPDDVDKTMETFAQVWDLEVGDYGYPAPLSDATSKHNGGDGRTDIYLANLGGDFVKVFGYCTTDDPHAFSSYRYFDVSAYCVVDEDFANFGSSHTPQDFRDVTAAHEFFHAIQFHYDWFEDLWLMEGTAMLMEGQFRPDVDDRIRYLDKSVLTSPSTPVDRGEDGFQYGAWIYWRFLVERYGELLDPLVIREIWERADGSGDADGPGPDTVGPNDYSLQATRHVVSDRGGSFGSLFAEFARWNRNPARFYEEGSSYPTGPTAATYTLERGSVTTGWQSTRLLHLAGGYYAFKPGLRTSRDATLRVSVNLPSLRHGSRASVLVRYENGRLRTRVIELDSSGDGSRTVPFGRGTVRKVDLVLTNASTRMACNRETAYSCAGTGLDDLRRYSYRAKLR